eukprot:TRINITY_DN2379_c1_g1_i1.p1 TRINITY_DN2379_c1_g1~~TRINITY_DN2379_c1_g1_i1.p1  ORF type:complete len:604 (+),score=142.60 TRINITY_DN2379_c1_g1_i1:56-1867(+)
MGCTGSKGGGGIAPPPPAHGDGAKAAPPRTQNNPHPGTGDARVRETPEVVTLKPALYPSMTATTATSIGVLQEATLAPGPRGVVILQQGANTAGGLNAGVVGAWGAVPWPGDATAHLPSETNCYALRAMIAADPEGELTKAVAAAQTRGLQRHIQDDPDASFQSSIGRSLIHLEGVPFTTSYVWPGGTSLSMTGPSHGGGAGVMEANPDHSLCTRYSGGTPLPHGSDSLTNLLPSLHSDASLPPHHEPPPPEPGFPRLFSSRKTDRRRRQADLRFGANGFFLPPLPPVPDTEREVWGQASAYHQQGYDALSERAWHSVVQRHQEDFVQGHTHDASVDLETLRCALCHLAATQHDQDKLRDAETSLRACLDDDYEAVPTGGPVNLVDVAVRFNLGLLLREAAGDLDEVEEHLRWAAEGLWTAAGPDAAETLTAVSELALVVLAQARVAEACFLAEYAYGTCGERFGGDHPETQQLRARLADLVAGSPLSDWYQAHAPTFPDEAMFVKRPSEPLPCAFAGAALTRVLAPAAAPCLEMHVGKVLVTYNGIPVEDDEHLAELNHAAFVALRFAARDTLSHSGDSSLSARDVHLRLPGARGAPSSPSS